MTRKAYFLFSMQHFHTGNLKLTTGLFIFFFFFSFSICRWFFFASQNYREVSEWYKQVCFTLMLYPHSLSLLIPSWNFAHTKKESHLSDTDCQTKLSVKQHFPQTVNTRNIWRKELLERKQALIPSGKKQTLILCLWSLILFRGSYYRGTF